MCYGSVTIEMQQSFSNNEVKLFLLDENLRDEKNHRFLTHYDFNETKR